MSLVVAAIRTRQTDDQYYERLAAGLGDKVRILPFLVGRTVLDVGAGGGELTAAIAASGFHTSALDASLDAVVRLRSIPGVTVGHGFADQATELFSGATFDSIVCSAVMHEVYSFGASTGALKSRAIRDTLTTLISLLNPGGRLIIRDGVMPDDYHAFATARVADADKPVVDAYLAQTPHPELAVRRSGNIVHGTKHAIAELLFTLTWGEDTFHREALERFQLHTLQGYADLMVTFGMTPIYAAATTQPGYVNALARIDVRDVWGAPWFPHTNALWVWEKP